MISEAIQVWLFVFLAVFFVSGCLIEIAQHLVSEDHRWITVSGATCCGIAAATFLIALTS